MPDAVLEAGDLDFLLFFRRGTEKSRSQKEKRSSVQEQEWKG